MSDAVKKLIEELHLEAGSSGSVEVLRLLKGLDVFEIEGLPYPLPMGFDDAWNEVFEFLLAAANKS